jgi:hypothetical protein
MALARWAHLSDARNPETGVRDCDALAGAEMLAAGPAERRDHLRGFLLKMAAVGAGEIHLFRAISFSEHFC